MGFWEDAAKNTTGFLGDTVDNLATGARVSGIPIISDLASRDYGLSETLSGGQTNPHTGSIDYASNPVTSTFYNNANENYQPSYTGNEIPSPTGYPTQVSNPTSTPASDSGGDTLGYSTGGSTTGSNGYTSGDIAALQENARLLNSLLGRLQGGIDRGQETINSQYNQELGNANLAKDRQLSTYSDQTTAQKTNRENQLGQINQNANVGMNSLRNIIGRSSGSGSSVYKDLLPYLVGNDMSSNRRGVMNTTGENIQSIDKAKNQYEADFSSVLQDLANQKKQNEQNLMSGIEGQRQGYLQQQIANQAQLSQAQGGGYDQVKQAITPFQNQYDQSLNSVESFFNQFKPNYTPNQKAAPTPELNTYTVDRANVNAASTPQAGDSNPYASLLRKKLTGQA